MKFYTNTTVTYSYTYKFKFSSLKRKRKWDNLLDTIYKWEWSIWEKLEKAQRFTGWIHENKTILWREW